jgi:hypothetical protein
MLAPRRYLPYRQGITERRNRDGSTVSYYALAENVWNVAPVVHNFVASTRSTAGLLLQRVCWRTCQPDR